MNGKILIFDNSNKRYRNVARKKAELGDYETSLGLLFCITDFENNVDAIMDIADTYADMGLLELSNKYWFKFLDKVSKDRVGVAYEELAINFFYLEDFWASSYYFHKKIEVDGYLSNEGIDQEILDFFTGEEHKKAFYHIAYPFDKADYSGKIKLAKHSIATGKFDEAVKILTAIPQECMNEEVFGELAIAYYMNDMLDESISVSKQSIKLCGDSVTAFCNLSTAYEMKKDEEKSKYYYQKALECKKGERLEDYKIATCAVEKGDHKVAKECLTTILKDRPYDAIMRFFYALTCVNLSEYELAEDEMGKVLRLDPADKIVNFYFKLIKKLKIGKADSQNLLPLKYIKEVPEKIEKEREKIIKNLANYSSDKISNEMRKVETKEILLWGLRSKNSDIARETVYILSNSFNSFSRKAMLSALIDNEILLEIKKVLVYSLTINNYSDRYGIVVGNVYIKVKPKKIDFYNKDKTGIFVRAYAMAISRAVFWDLEKIDKIAVSAEKMFKMLNGAVEEADVTSSELAALIIYLCKFNKLKQKQIIAHLFEIKDDRFEKLTRTLLGEKDDKNN